MSRLINFREFVLFQDRNDQCQPFQAEFVHIHKTPFLPCIYVQQEFPIITSVFLMQVHGRDARKVRANSLTASNNETL